MEETKKPLMLAHQTAAQEGRKEKILMRHYNTKNRKMEWFRAVMTLILAAILCWGGIEIHMILHRPAEWKPAESFPMANAKISWEQTFHGGAWR